MPTSVLLTGASGKVARVLRPHLLARFGTLRLTDRVAPESLAASEQFVSANLLDPKETAAAMRGVGAVVHFAGLPGEADWDTVVQTSMLTTINVLEGARHSGVERVILASSNHVDGYYRRSERLDGNQRVRPDSRYGVAKAFGEACLSLYADKYGMRCMSIRIGTVIDRPRFVRELSTFHHPEDLAQLIAIGATHPQVRNEIVFGLSENARAWCDNARAEALGYRPVHRAEDHVAFAVEGQTRQADDALSDALQGGGMASAEFSGESANLLGRDARG